jgi:hypothetical protein
MKKSKHAVRFLSLTLMLCAVAVGCKQDLSDDPVPYVPFQEIRINLGLPEYFSLRSVGTYKYIDGGVRGIILYRESIGRFVAFERNCTYQPNDACATVEVEPSGFRMFDSCCGSVFSWDGNPVEGAAWRPLTQYRVESNGQEVIITDEVTN